MFGARIMDIMELDYVKMMMDNIWFWDWLVGCLVLLDCYVIDDICLGIVVIYVCGERNMRCLLRGYWGF